ncbi:MAG TPA: formate dehydrogenase accessory sulfurtransferase FdhD [Candidatus Binataceae bacterium]|nr:formate dehydrogenase accessory sulfurtransferase FdhD [Candidatus Binataceae bacterium]
MADFGGKKTLECATRRWRASSFTNGRDLLAVEEPLEIRLAGRRFTVTMRTPGHDEELVAGFLFAEGFVSAANEIGEIRRVRGKAGKPEPNVIDVILHVPVEDLRERLQRNFTMTASCGLCGKTSIEAIERRIAPLSPRNFALEAAVLLSLGAKMRGEQTIFADTGGVHAAALFDRSGALRALREDIGRHNAVDKLIGWALGQNKLPLGDSLVMVSGRLSFEIVQKVAAAGAPLLAAVSAPSSLAVELADQVGITLLGFLRDGAFNVYTHPERVIGPACGGS